jgi:hypothetical protein
MLEKLLLFFSSVLNIISPKVSGLPPQTVELTCPSGYILVPGNREFNTNDFCVMKYDAKCSNSDPKCVTSEGVYNNSLPKCTCLEKGFTVVSKPDGAPITFIPEESKNEASAIKYCQSVGGHLITNNEWMSLARNVEQVRGNWCDKNGTNCGADPGSAGKILSNGHNDSNPNRALESSTDDKPCFGTTSDGSDICGGKSSQKRTLKLSNGNIIWDLAGNVWQWVDFKIPRNKEPLSKNPANKYGRWVWEEFQMVDYDPMTMPANPNWSSKEGVGRIFHYSYFGDTDTTLYTNIRGGNWRHGYDSGAFTSHFQPVPGKGGIDDVGFRCVTDPK